LIFCDEHNIQLKGGNFHSGHFVIVPVNESRILDKFSQFDKMAYEGKKRRRSLLFLLNYLYYKLSSSLIDSLFNLNREL
jgi:hypothetical protein